MPYVAELINHIRDRIYETAYLACCNTSSTAVSGWSGGYLYLRKMRFTISRSLACTLSRADQSTLSFLRRFSANSWAIFYRVSSVSSRTADSLLVSAS